MAKFFKHGRVEVLCADDTSRQVAMDVCVPNCIMQACCPMLLGFGLIDGLKVRNPLSAWISVPSADGYKSEVTRRSPNVQNTIKDLIESKMEDVLKTFAYLSEALTDPGDVASMLPMGTYVEFRYRCRVDDVAPLLLGIGSLRSHGVPEFQFAMATELAGILRKTGDVIIDEAST